MAKQRIITQVGYHWQRKFRLYNPARSPALPSLDTNACSSGKLEIRHCPSFITQTAAAPERGSGIKDLDAFVPLFGRPSVRPSNGWIQIQGRTSVYPMSTGC